MSIDCQAERGHVCVSVVRVQHMMADVAREHVTHVINLNEV